MKRCLRCSAAISADEWSCPQCSWKPAAEKGIVILAPELVDEPVSGDDALAYLTEYDSVSFWFRARAELITWAMARYFPSCKSFLELGCGTGYVADFLGRRFTGLEVVAADASMAALKVARERHGCNSLYQLDAGMLPFDSEFDVIGAFDLIEHIGDDRRALAEMRRALKSDGGVIITVPQHRWLWSKVDEYAHHHRRYTRAGLTAMLEAEGFRVVRATAFMMTILPAIAARRFLGRSDGEAELAREFAWSARVVRLLGAAMAAERSIIRMGANLPIGGSLLVVAKAA